MRNYFPLFVGSYRGQVFSLTSFRPPRLVFSCVQQNVATIERWRTVREQHTSAPDRVTPTRRTANTPRQGKSASLPRSPPPPSLSLSLSPSLSLSLSPLINLLQAHASLNRTLNYDGGVFFGTSSTAERTIMKSDCSTRMSFSLKLTRFTHAF